MVNTEATIFYESFPNDLKNMKTFMYDENNYRKLKDYISCGYTVDGYENGKYRFIKLKSLDLDMEQYKNVHYELFPPIDPINYLSNKLIVCFPELTLDYSVSARERMYSVNSFSSLPKEVAKNTYIIKIADSNLISGSYYLNTDTYPTFELEIQELITSLCEEYDISHNNVLLYGGSRGGTAALIHGFIGNYAAVSIDPVINRIPWIDRHDIQLMFNFIPFDFSETINCFAKRSSLNYGDIQILSSEQIVITYPYFRDLDLTRISLINLNINILSTQPFALHGLFIQKTVPYQLSLINMLLYRNDSRIEIELDDQIAKMAKFPEQWSVYLPPKNPYFTIKKNDTLKIIRNNLIPDGNSASWLAFFLKNGPLLTGKKYVLEIKTKNLYANFEVFMFGDSRVQKIPKKDPIKLRDYYFYSFEITPNFELTSLSTTTTFFEKADDYVEISDIQFYEST